MPAAKVDKNYAFMSRTITKAVETNADTQSQSLASREQRIRAKFCAEWQKLIDDVLLSWLREPEQLRDMDTESPSSSILRLAIDYAEKFRDEFLPPPDQIVPDGSGGIVMERRDAELREVLYIWDDGNVEYQLYQNSQLIDRSSF